MSAFLRLLGLILPFASLVIALGASFLAIRMFVVAQEARRMTTMNVALLQSLRSVLHGLSAGQRAQPAQIQTAPPPADVVVLRGADNISSAAIGLLNALTDDPGLESSGVLVTQLGAHVWDDVGWLSADWRTALANALQRGHAVSHVLRAPKTDESDRLVMLIAQMLELLGHRGQYQAFLVAGPAGPLVTDLVIISDAAALICFPGENRALDVALIVSNPDQVQAVTEIGVRFVQDREPLLTQVRTDEDFNNELTRVEGGAGPRYLVKAGLSVLQIPPEIRTDWKRREQEFLKDPWTEERLVAYHDRLRVRQASFLEQVTTTPYFEVCSTEALQEFIANGLLPRDDVAARIRAELIATELERRTVAESIAERLRKYRNYHLGLLEKGNENDPRTFWEVKGSWVLAEIFSENDSADWRNLVIHSPLLAGALESYFLTEVWQGIPAKWRENESMADWLLQTTKSRTEVLT